MASIGSFALYAHWYTCMQRPQHFVRTVGREHRVDLFSWRGFHVEEVNADVLAMCRSLRVRRLLSSRLDLVGLATRFNRYQRQELMREFIRCEADLHLYSARPEIVPEQKPRTLVYDCMDEWSGFPGTSASILAVEEELCEMADRIWVVSSPLLERLGKRFGAKVDYVPNGVDVEHFARAQDMRIQNAPGRPTLGYVGAIDDWFDGKLVSAVAALLNDWKVVLVGPVNPNSGQVKLLNHPNIEVLGKRPYSELPSLLASFSVAMIPFQISPLTVAVSPIKLYEYLAAGLPVVSTALPEVVCLEERGAVACVEGATSFAAAVDRIASEAEAARCQQIAAKHSWQARFEQALSRLRD